MKKFLTFVLLLGFAPLVRANLYMADMISVSAEANTAVEARDLALNHAVREAFPQMIHRVALSDASHVDATPAEISALVQGVSLANEKTTPTKYMADVTVQFKPKEVQDFLNRNGVLYVTKEPPKYLFIPLFIEGDKAVIFDEQSPLFSAMKKGLSGASVYEFTTPLGDDQDKAAATLSVLNGADLSELNSLLIRYRTDYALLIRVSKTKNVYKVQAKSYPENATGEADVLFAVSSASPNVPAVMTQILKKTAGEMEKKWRAAQTQQSDQKGDLTIIFPINGLGEWTAIEKQLKSLPFIDQVTVQALHKNQVFVKLSYAGSTDAVVRKMDRAGFQLKSGYDGTWEWDKLGTGTQPDAKATDVQTFAPLSAPQTTSASATATDSFTAPGHKTPARSSLF